MAMIAMYKHFRKNNEFLSSELKLYYIIAIAVTSWEWHVHVITVLQHYSRSNALSYQHCMPLASSWNEICFLQETSLAKYVAILRKIVVPLCKK